MARKEPLFGSHRWLSEEPPFAVFMILLVASVVFPYVGRFWFEGRGYSVSFSSMYGDVLLSAVVAIGGSVIYHDGVYNLWQRSFGYHFWRTTLSLLLGLSLGGFAIHQTRWQQSQIVDLAHNFIFVPMFTYLLTTTVPITWRQGSRMQKCWTAIMIVGWVSLLFIDMATGRIHQREWMMAHGMIK